MPDQKISELTALTTPDDADVAPIVDTSETETKKITWANIKATLKTYFDTLYSAFENHAASHQDGGNDEISVAALSGVLADDQHVIDSEVNALVVATKIDDLTAGDDNTDLDADESAHGLCWKLGQASVDTSYIPLVLFNTDATPPAASGFPLGTIYIQYTA